jgi:lactate dehydrogenase-like 2-hydroxyacid dehydrogenase
VIATFSVGYDHIDDHAAAARGIAVCNTPDVLSVTTAETALLLMLMAARRAGEGGRMVRAGRWHGWAPTGRIGRELARLARGIGMIIHYRDVVRLPAELEAAATYHDYDATFLGACDVLSLTPGGGSS